MYNWLSPSRTYCNRFSCMAKTVLCYVLMSLVCSCGLVAQSSTGYYVVAGVSSDDNQWVNYFCDHINKRASLLGVAVKEADMDKGEKKALRIVLHQSPSMTEDYKITFGDEEVRLEAKDNGKMIWLMYQLMQMIGERDNRIDVTDLPPSYLKYGMNASGTFAFDHRSLYTSANTDPELMPILGVGNVDYDWGLWGHNLQKAIGKNPGESVYALIDGARNSDQFCFSSDVLYNRLVNYILNNYGEIGKNGEAYRFAIMPNDNDLVCQCEACRRAGNTLHSATPAVSAMVTRLAKRFPHYLFFTSSYLTTEQLPSQKFPPNVGVLISAMDLPMTTKIADTPQARKFGHLLDQWRGLCNHIYIWDYCCNFDDYLTPYPCLYVQQKRLLFYKQHGVTGIVYNGSGPDYSTFDDAQSYVLAQLMNDPTADVQSLINVFFDSRYPTSSTILKAYYDPLEQQVLQSGVELPLYGGIDEAESKYLNATTFNKFFNDLDKAAKKVDGDERARLNLLLTGFNFTLLELQRSHIVPPNKDAKAQYLENLKGHSDLDHFSVYREANGNLDDYINYMQSHDTYRGQDLGNVIYHQAVRSVTPLDEGCKPLSVLTDGVVGIPYDYHVQWLIHTGSKMILQIPVSAAGNYTVSIGLLQGEPWHINYPQRIEIWQGNKQLSVRTTDWEEQAPIERKDEELEAYHSSAGTPLEIRIYAVDGKKVALDEIELIKD